MARQTKTLPGFQLIERLRPLQPYLFLLLVPLVMFAAFAYNMRKTGIFACPPSYEDNHYLGYCQATAYGDFDHGAFWFGLEPEARNAAASAQVLFIGNSRLQFGLSSHWVDQWFADRGATFYFMGFSHSENMTFIAPLLKALEPKARAYVINVDGFFDETPSPPGQDVLGSGDAERRYLGKQRWQPFHKAICTRVPRLCTGNIAYYRQRDTGQWRIAGDEGLPDSGIETELPLDPAKVERAKKLGPAFIAGLNAPRACIFLTYVPHKDNEAATARAIARALGFELIAPTIDGLRTFDGSHLTPVSAGRYAKALLDEAGDRIDACAHGRVQ